MREAIRRHQRSSEVSSGHQRSSEVLRGPQRSSEVLRGHQRFVHRLMCTWEEDRTAAACEPLLMILARHEAVSIEHLPRRPPARLAVIDEHLYAQSDVLGTNQTPIRRNQTHHQRCNQRDAITPNQAQSGNQRDTITPARPTRGRFPPSGPQRFLCHRAARTP